MRGGFSSRKDRRATEWRLAEHACDVTGELATKSFMRWTLGSDFTVRRQGQAVLQGGQGVLLATVQNRNSLNRTSGRTVTRVSGLPQYLRTDTSNIPV